MTDRDLRLPTEAEFALSKAIAQKVLELGKQDPGTFFNAWVIGLCEIIKCHKRPAELAQDVCETLRRLFLAH